MADIFPVYTAVRDHLQAAVEASGAGFVDGYVNEGDESPKNSDGSLLPFVTFIIGDPMEHFRGKGICGPVNDLETLDFLVICTASANHHVIGLIDVVSKALIGFRPTEDTGPIRRIGGTISTPVGALLHPIRYNKGISFALTIGATTDT